MLYTNLEDLSFTTLGAADQMRADALLADQAQKAAAAAESGNPDDPAPATTSAARAFQHHLRDLLEAHYARTDATSPPNTGKFAGHVPPTTAKASGVRFEALARFRVQYSDEDGREWGSLGTSWDAYYRHAWTLPADASAIDAFDPTWKATETRPPQAGNP